jgi:hypothetical protein
MRCYEHHGTPASDYYATNVIGRVPANHPFLFSYEGVDATVEFLTNESGEVSGFTAANGRTRGIILKKQ